MRELHCAIPGTGPQPDVIHYSTQADTSRRLYGNWRQAMQGATFPNRDGGRFGLIACALELGDPALWVELGTHLQRNESDLSNGILLRFSEATPVLADAAWAQKVLTRRFQDGPDARSVPHSVEPYILRHTGVRHGDLLGRLKSNWGQALRGVTFANRDGGRFGLIACALESSNMSLWVELGAHLKSNESDLSNSILLRFSETTPVPEDVTWAQSVLTRRFKDVPHMGFTPPKRKPYTRKQKLALKEERRKRDKKLREEMRGKLPTEGEE